MALATDSNLSLPRKKKGEDIDGSVWGKLTKTEPLLESCLDQPVETRHEVVNHTTISPLPGKNYDADTTEPISSGLVTLEELLSWQREANPFDVATVPLANREPPLADCPQRTLVSHDMMGGYLEDRFIQGTDSEAPYAFYHWQYIDIFNYFSHKLVTIPPAVWTNAAHKHGVIVLGTFITEWKEGSTVCEDILKEEESYRSVADKLVQVSHCHGFDGWLINIENPLSEVAVKNTPLFLRYLTDQMHERIPGSLVVWYDSILEDGKLLWQNELNENNRVFFNACDGLFTNYNWTAQSLEAMQAYSGAEGRQADIYVGVDVFARGEVVGGQLETNKALSIIREHNFSAAIFAPGWVYESLVDKTEFCKNQDNFWALLSGYLHVHRPVSTLPFISSFCQGFGKALYWRGQEVVKRSWFHLSAQELQPLYYSHQLEGQGWMKSRGCHDDAWHGGSSLLLEGVLPASLNKICARVFSLHIPLASDILVGLIYKPSAGITVSLELKTTDASLCTHKGVRGLATTSVSPQPLPDSHTLMTHMSELCGQLNPQEWRVRCHQLAFQGCALRAVSLNIQREGEPQDTPFTCRLGEFIVLDVASLQADPQAVGNVCIDDVIWLKSASLCLNATLRWSYPAGRARYFRVHCRRLRGPDPRISPGSLELVGRCYSTLYRVTELQVAQPPALLELLVEPVTKEGFPVPAHHWGRRSLSYTE